MLFTGLSKRLGNTIHALGALIICATVAAQPARAAAVPVGFTDGIAEQPGILDRMGFTPMSLALPGKFDPSTLRFDRSGHPISKGIVQPPLWPLNVGVSPVNKQSYLDTLLGVPPGDAKSANIGLFVITWKFEFSNGLVTDGTKPSCGESTSVVNRYFDSPLINDANFTSNGVSVGDREYVDAFQTAEFTGTGWSSKWRTNFVYALPKKTYWIITIKVPAADGHAVNVQGCSNPFGYLNLNWADAQVQNWIQKLGYTHAYIPFNLFNNTVMYTVNKNGTTSCCVIGYHSNYGTSTYNQVYGVGSYVEPGLFSGLSDVAALSHEMAELTNNPLVTSATQGNATPAWGHIGQVSGCQGNFEVGDPLSGHQWTYTFNGFNYHLQDLAFISWFYRLKSGSHAKFGTDGKFSFRGTLTTDQSTVCKT
jgi:hypothetical protein